MSWAHPEFKEYATCEYCGYKKYCLLDGKHFICYSCKTKKEKKNDNA